MLNFHNKYDDYGNILEDEFGNNNNMNYDFNKTNQFTENNFVNNLFDVNKFLEYKKKMQLLENKKQNKSINNPANKFEDPSNKAYQNQLITLANLFTFDPK